MKEEIVAICITGLLVLFDYATGLAKAVHAHDISSEKLREGLWHKSAYALVVILAEIVEHAQQWVDLGVTVPLIVPACVYICVTEIASIIENIGELNPELNGTKLLSMFRNGGTTTPNTTPKHKREE